MKILNQRKLIIALFLIVFFSFAVKLYYLFVTKNQPLWWDEAEYVSAAKKIAFGIPYDLNPQRPLLFQMFEAVLLKLGFSELFLKFFLVLLPSVILVFLVYILISKIYNEKIGLVASFLTGINWSLIFWSNRMQPDYISLCFQVLALYFACLFWKGDRSNKTIALIGVFSAVAFQFKVSAMLVPAIIFFYSLIKDRQEVFIKKEYWAIVLWFIIGLVPQFIFSMIYFGDPFSIFTDSGYAEVITEKRSLGWQVFSFIPLFTKNIIFILFLVGLIQALSFLLKIDLIFKEKKFDPDLLTVLSLGVIVGFYLFYIRGSIEDRWVFLIIPFTYALSGKAIYLIYEFIRKNSKFLSLLVLALILGFGAISHISHAGDLIEIKKDTYYQIKEASIYIKENSNPGDKIFSVSYTQTTNYAEREVISYARLPLENFTLLLNEEKPRFIMLSLIEPNHPEWMVQRLTNEEGFQGMFFQYFNSSIIVSPQNQIVQYDLKKVLTIEDKTYTLMYPTDNNFGGVIVYKIDYN